MANRPSPNQLREAERRIQQALTTSAARLSLNGLSLTEVPVSVSQLRSISNLVLTNNNLVTVPDFVWGLDGLANLDISNNRLELLPDGIRSFTNLARLHLRNNRLKSLPRDLTALPLRILDIRDNLGLGIPPEIASSRYDQGPAPPSEILSFYFKEETRYLNEAKILLVGQGGVGKTSLVKRLLRDEFDEYERKTEGISINQWVIPAQRSKGQDDKVIRLNILDFGGQEIMHATHQFF